MFEFSSSAITSNTDLDTMSLADAVSVAHSQVTNFSVGFMANFEWLFLPHSSDLSEEAWKEKENEILDCLQGTDDVVDLWALRELALSKGGLLTPNLRKRAWLKLAACHEQVLSRKHQPLVDPSRSDMDALKRNVSRTIWNVEEHLTASKKEQKEQEEKLQQFLELQRQRGRKRVSFAPMTQGIGIRVASPSPVSVRSDPPKTIAASPASDDEEEKADDSINLSCEEMGNFSPGNSVLTQETNFTLGSRVVRWRKASKQEQKILFNIITAVLRTEAAPSAHFEDDRYHYFPGLQDITALLLINLESPSLTSMVLNKLAEGHLRDSMRADRLIVETAIAHLFMPLLESVDCGLYDHLHAAGITLPTFSRQWIICWFAQDVPNVQLASRIMDVLMASHPLMPLYMAVAILTVNRSRIFNAHHQLSAVYAIMRSLPMQNLASADGDSMVHVEQVIETAVSYMKRIPPDCLLAAAKNRLGPNDDQVKALLPAIAMFQDPPVWTTAAEAPNDWSLLRRAKALRQQKDEPEAGNREQESKPESQKPNPIQYPLAVAAAGFTRVSYTRSSSLLLGFLVVGLLLSLSVALVSFSNGRPTFAVGPMKLFQKLFRPADFEPRSRQRQLFLPSVKRQKKMLHLIPKPTAVDKNSAFVSRPVAINNSAGDTKPAVTCIAGVSTFLEKWEFTSLTESYYAVGSFVVDKPRHFLSLLRLQLGKLRGVWEKLAPYWHRKKVSARRD